MKHVLLISLLFIPTISLWCQQTEGRLLPGQSYTNSSDQVLFYMPRDKVVNLLNCQTKLEYDSLRLNKYKELVVTMEMRIGACDSAITLRSLEADYWKMQLESNDRELEKVKIDKATLMDENQRIRSSRIYYLLAGILSTSIVYISLK